MLNDWNLDVTTKGYRNYVELLECTYHDLKNKNRQFKEFDKEELRIFISWIESNVHKLEEGFFKYESTDEEFSDRISNILYMVERIE